MCVKNWMFLNCKFPCLMSGKYLSFSIIIIIVLVIKQILLITHMITDQIGLHSVLLPFLIIVIIILLLLLYHPLLLSGGGVLAHTILGVDFNDQTGDIRWAATCPWDWATIKKCQKIHQKNQLNPKKACKNSRFSSLLATGDVAPRGTSVPQWGKFHTDDINQCLCINPVVMEFQM